MFLVDAGVIRFLKGRRQCHPRKAAERDAESVVAPRGTRHSHELLPPEQGPRSLLLLPTLDFLKEVTARRSPRGPRRRWRTRGDEGRRAEEPAEQAPARVSGMGTKVSAGDGRGSQWARQRRARQGPCTACAQPELCLVGAREPLRYAIDNIENKVGDHMIELQPLTR